MSAPCKLEILPLSHFPLVNGPCDLGALVVACLKRNRITLRQGDVLVLAHKVVSKAEGRIVDLGAVSPSARALELAQATGKEPALLEVILSQTKRIVRQSSGVILCENHLGIVCANAGVDRSNAGENQAVLLPQDPDRSARALCHSLEVAFQVKVGVLVADSHGRPWREGAVGLCIGLAGIHPFIDYRGRRDLYCYQMQSEIECIADELCAAATLVMGQAQEGIPLALVRGAPVQLDDASSAASLLRDPARDLFR